MRPPNDFDELAPRPPMLPARQHASPSCGVSSLLVHTNDRRSIVHHCCSLSCARTRMACRLQCDDRQTQQSVKLVPANRHWTELQQDEVQVLSLEVAQQRVPAPQHPRPEPALVVVLPAVLKQNSTAVAASRPTPAAVMVAVLLALAS
jgi:hypothetical protein